MRNMQCLVDRGMAKFQVMLALLLFLTNVHTKYEHLLPEMKMNVSQLISYNEYPCENHEVETVDGYILSVQRIPHGRKNVQAKKGVVLLQHGFIDSAATWVENLPSQSLGFILADAGYDVWLANSRGNTYSAKHIIFTQKDAGYWDFSFEDMARYDLPAVIQHVLKTSEASQLHYVGHSQGSTIAFIEFSRNQQLASKIKTFFALAPVAEMAHIKGLFKLASEYSSQAEHLFKEFGIHDFAPNNWFFKLQSKLCEKLLIRFICEKPIFSICGYDTKNLNETRLPVYLAHTPAGTSVKNAVHFVQLIKSGRFQRYDYGKHDNIKRYGQNTPPTFDITKLKVPTVLFTATEDWLADPTDIKDYLIPHVNHTVIFNKNIDEWNHLDFVLGKDANKIIYKKMIEIMN